MTRNLSNPFEQESIMNVDLGRMTTPEIWEMMLSTRFPNDVSSFASREIMRAGAEEIVARDEAHDFQKRLREVVNSFGKGKHTAAAVAQLRGMADGFDYAFSKWGQNDSGESFWRKVTR